MGLPPSMSDTSNDELRIRATEAQMRRALGLNDQPSTPGHAPPTASTGAGASHPQRRRFVRDGEVPVSVIHRDQGEPSGTNALEAARQALREQVAAREHTEHLLQEAQATVHDLQTKLVHERFARDEAVQRTDGERQVVEQALQSVQEELSAQRANRQKAEEERDEAVAARQEAEEQLLEMLATRDAQMPSPGASNLTNDPAGGSVKERQARRRGRPAKSDQSEAEFVEWWKPGWRDRFR
jgi:hypothetical protein